MLFPDDAGIQNARGGVQRIHRRVDPQLGDRAGEVGGGVQVGEGRGRGRICIVVGRHVDGLNRGDGAFLGRGDPLLQLAHLGRQVGLIAHGRGHATQQGRDFRAGLGETEDVVDEEENVLPLFVPKVFGHGQAGQPHPQPRSGRLGHLAVDQRRLVDDSGLGHFQPQVVALPGAFSDPREHREAAVLGGDVVDQLLDDDRLPHARSAEQPDLAAPEVGLQQVHHLDAGLEHLQIGILIVEQRGRPMNGIALGSADGPLLVDGLTDDVHDASQHLPAHRHRDGSPGIDGLHAPNHAVGGLHRDRTHSTLSQVLLHLGNHIDGIGNVKTLAGDSDSGVDGGQLLLLESHVHNRTDHLNHTANVHR